MDNSLVRALVVGLVLAVIAVGLFLLLYFVLFVNSEPAIRLFASLCSPPFVLLFGVGGYYLLTQDEKKS